MSASPIGVAIVDDEPLARRKLRLLFDSLPDFLVRGEAGDGRAAIRLIRDEQPRLICLDIRLPGMSGLDVLRNARPRAAVIFTTAFDRYAVTAFELAAVDYLLKPFSRERFLAAVERARLWLEAAHGAPAAERFREVSTPRYLTRLFARDGGVVVPVAAAAVQHLESRDDSVIVHAGGRRYTINVTLQSLESRLDPAQFLRVHRGTIVNLDHVAGIEPVPGSRFRVRMRDGAMLTASRERSRRLRIQGL